MVLLLLAGESDTPVLIKPVVNPVPVLVPPLAVMIRIREVPVAVLVNHDCAESPPRHHSLSAGADLELYRIRHL